MIRLWILLLCSALTLATTSYEPRKSYPKYDYCNPLKAPKCAGKYNTSFCLEDKEYPLYDVQTLLKNDDYLEKKYSDVPDQSAYDLVEGITKTQEDSFDYSFYTGSSKGYSRFDETHWMGPEGYNCPSDVLYAKARRAANVAGEWRVIVNDVEYYGKTYTQTVRLESCLFPHSACRLLAPCFGSACLQQYVYHRLLSLDPCDLEKGLFIDLYKLPSGCSCNLSKY